MASQASRMMLLGRILPRVHSALATPSKIEHFVQQVTPQGVSIVRVPFLKYDEFYKRVSDAVLLLLPFLLLFHISTIAFFFLRGEVELANFHQLCDSTAPPLDG